jgi:hypothetical protein
LLGIGHIVGAFAPRFTVVIVDVVARCKH